MPLTWLPEWSVAAVRAVLRPVGLGDGQIVLNGRVDTGAALWATGSSVVDGRFVAKFALSAPTAERLWREPRRLFWRYAVTNPIAIFQLLTKTR